MDYDGGKIQDSVRFILEVLASYGRRITFFVVAELDEAFPGLLADIKAAGHEIGVHSYRHDELSTVPELRNDLERAADFKRKYDVVSFRAPRVSVQDSFYSVLREYGYRCDSSVYGARSFKNSGVSVMPVATRPLSGKPFNRVPCTFGQGLKQMTIPFGSGISGPLGFSAYRHLIDWYQRRYCEAPCIFLHSWQVRQPKYPLRFFLRNPAMLPYSVECSRLFEQLCGRYDVVPMREYVNE
jgi:hypothetical protein